MERVQGHALRHEIVCVVVRGIVAFQVLDPVEAYVAGGAKETLTRIPLDRGVIDRNRWGIGIEVGDWAKG